MSKRSEWIAAFKAAEANNRNTIAQPDEPVVKVPTAIPDKRRTESMPENKNIQNADPRSSRISEENRTVQPKKTAKSQAPASRGKVPTTAKRNTVRAKVPQKSAKELNDISAFRQEIIRKIKENPELIRYYKLCVFSDYDHPQIQVRYGKEYAFYYLNLESHELRRETQDYYDHGHNTETVTAEELYKDVLQYNGATQLLAFKTKQDWEILFDDELNKAVADADAAVERQKEEDRKREVQKYAIVIPKALRKKKPDMIITKLHLHLQQRYGSRGTNLYQKDGKYYFGVTIGDKLYLGRERNNAEAVWIEKRVMEAIESQDLSTWESLPGGDKMDVEIEINGKPVSYSSPAHGVYHKYSDLLYDLNKLQKYGSRIE